jgi:hypothetical protein
MKELAIICHDSIGPIKLGATRIELRRILDSHDFHLESTKKTMDYFCDASIQVEYEEDDTASFIGISFHRLYTCTYSGRNVFDTPAEELFSLMAAAEGDGTTHTFDDSEYVFPNQILALWDADPQYDRLGGENRSIWAQVGIGDARYLAAIAKCR